jgi:cell division protein ZapD
MLPLKQSIVLLLRLLRESGKEYQFTALHGAFQQMQGGRVAQMLRISMRKELPCIPEVSANKYALNIRFIEVSFISAKTVLFDQDIPFDLTFCSL